MPDPLHEQLEAWHDFYLVVGTGATTLTGLLFVIVSLGPHVLSRHKSTGVRAFVSPVAAHFTYVLVISALMLAPEIPRLILAGAVGAAGLGGIVFTTWTRAHQRWRANGLSNLDWVWFVGMPYLCFASLLVSSACLAWHGDLGLFGIGATSVLLIVVGIRNAWDLALWISRQPRPGPREEKGRRR
ncbi:MAG TPA: hypothetical protein VFE23_07615 [Usitatibacter sp.]|jgi:hypothetical protein|nr:hypothetical protein [Usitatibacter sp.]